MSNNLIAERYEVFKHIGQGGMADVFLAVDTILHRQVAIKILRSELCTDAVSVLRFEREAQAATALSHPNIVEIYDVGEYKGHHYIVMEYVEGRTLKKVIQQRGALLKEETVDIMKQLVSATSEAHRRGIIHRDIKPQNVIVKSDGSIKILDFGIALAKGSIQLTQANNVMGSVHYLAPELARGESATAQSDIYALGIVMYEMLVGDVPFKADSAVQVALLQMRNDVPDIRTINSLIPQSLSNIILRATAKDPSRRYRSCNEMLLDLKTCLRAERLNEPKVNIGKSVAIRELEEKEKIYDQTIQQDKQVVRTNERLNKPAVEKKVKHNKFAMALLVTLLCALAVSGIYFGVREFQEARRIASTVEVPDLTGLTLIEAKDVCFEKELQLDTTNVTYTLTKDIEKGKIIEVHPLPNTEVDKNTTLSVVVSSGIGVEMKDYRGTNINAALDELAKYPYLKVESSDAENEDEEIAPGAILTQELLNPGDEFNPEKACQVRFTYKKYPTIQIPPDIEGKTVDAATAQLEALGAKVLTSNLDTSKLTEAEIANLKTGIVIKSDPEITKTYTQKEDNYVILYYY